MSFFLDAGAAAPIESRHWHSAHIESAQGRARDLLAEIGEGEIEIYDEAGRHVATVTKNNNQEDQCPSL